MTENRFFLIVGCGRLGSLLANHLSLEGHQIVILDRNEKAFDSLAPNFTGYKVLGDASEKAILIEAKIEQADYLFAVTAIDNVNIMVAQIAKRIFDVPRVIARVEDPHREALYQEFGIETINAIQLVADAFVNRLDKDGRK